MKLAPDIGAIVPSPVGVRPAPGEDPSAFFAPLGDGDPTSFTALENEHPVRDYLP